jgi:hypothetical protein
MQGKAREQNRHLALCCLLTLLWCRLLGSCSSPDPLAAVQAYNKQYDRGLHLLLNNCMHYTNGLTKALMDPQRQQAVTAERQQQQ